MVLQEKFGEDGCVERFKARLVEHRFRQHPGIESSKTYSPTISFPAIRIVLSKAAAEDKEIVELDIITPFSKAK